MVDQHNLKPSCQKHPEMWVNIYKILLNVPLSLKERNPKVSEMKGEQSIEVVSAWTSAEAPGSPVIANSGLGFQHPWKERPLGLGRVRCRSKTHAERRGSSGSSPSGRTGEKESAPRHKAQSPLLGFGWEGKVSPKKLKTCPCASCRIGVWGFTSYSPRPRNSQAEVHTSVLVPGWWHSWSSRPNPSGRSVSHNIAGSVCSASWVLG